MASSPKKQTITTLRVRPARTKVLTEQAVARGDRNLSEVTVFGQTIAIYDGDGTMIKAVDEIAVECKATVDKVVKEAYRLMTAAASTGLMGRNGGE